MGLLIQAETNIYLSQDTSWKECSNSMKHFSGQQCPYCCFDPNLVTHIAYFANFYSHNTIYKGTMESQVDGGILEVDGQCMGDVSQLGYNKRTRFIYRYPNGLSNRCTTLDNVNSNPCVRIL